MFTGRYAVQWEYRMRVDRSLHPKTEVGGAIRHTLLLRITHPFGYAEAPPQRAGHERASGHSP